MTKLSDEQKLYIVQRLACFASPSQIASEVKEQWGLTLSLPRISFYNPQSAMGQRELSEAWKQLFAETRRLFLERASDIPIAQQAYRLVRLQEIADNSSVKATVMKALEQAAKECGGAFTNKREISGPGGKPIAIDATARDEAGKELETWRQAQAASLPNLLDPPKE